MKRGHRSTFKPEASVVDAALDAMDAGALRELVRGVLSWLDDKLHSKVTGEIIDRAARSKGEWTPDTPSDESVAEVMVSAAKLLTRAPGLGWSRSEHPGPLLFPLFCRMIGSTIQDLGLDAGYRGHRDFDELEMIGRDRDEPRLHSPSVEDVLALAGIDKVEDSSARAAMLNAMQKAAKKRLDGVTENKRRRYYGHAASLAVACAAVDSALDSEKWLAGVRDESRRYPALQREFEGLGRRR